MSDKMAPALDAMGRRIRVLRAERGLSCRDLAALIGVSPMAVSKWENGAAPTSTNLLAVARALGCSVEFLLGDWRRDVAVLRDCIQAGVAAGVLGHSRASELLRAFDLGERSNGQ